MPEKKTTKPSGPVGISPAADAEAKKRQRVGGQQSGRRRRQKSRYGSQMDEKQSLKGIYNIREEQLRRYYTDARKAKLETGPELISLLERRLDNALFRSGFSETRPAARQLASHRLVAVNGRPVTIPSHRLRPGDKVTIRVSKRTKPLFNNFVKRLQNIVSPSWITIDPEQFCFTVNALPTAEEAAIGVDIRAVVEYFAR